MENNDLQIIAKNKVKNYLNIKPEDLDLPIYRFTTFEQFLDILNTNELTLVKPIKWEDPYENYILKCNYKNKNNENINVSNLMDQIFAQCWTFCSESDALWRIYSKDSKGIRLQTTVRKLLDTIFDDTDMKSILTSFIGKVKYLTIENIEKYLSDKETINNLFLNGSTNEFRCKSLLIKRKEFEHEMEIRLLYLVDSDSIDIHYNSKKFCINPNNLIERVLLDPRMPNDYQNVITSTSKQLCYNNPITKSELYKFNPINLII